MGEKDGVKERVTCAACDGCGRLVNDDEGATVTCAACDGVGHVTIKRSRPLAPTWTAGARVRVVAEWSRFQGLQGVVRAVADGGSLDVHVPRVGNVTFGPSEVEAVSPRLRRNDLAKGVSGRIVRVVAVTDNDVDVERDDGSIGRDTLDARELTLWQLADDTNETMGTNAALPPVWAPLCEPTRNGRVVDIISRGRNAGAIVCDTPEDADLIAASLVAVSLHDAYETQRKIATTPLGDDVVVTDGCERSILAGDMREVPITEALANELRDAMKAKVIRDPSLRGKTVKEVRSVAERAIRDVLARTKLSTRLVVQTAIHADRTLLALISLAPAAEGSA